MFSAVHVDVGDASCRAGRGDARRSTREPSRPCSSAVTARNRIERSAAGCSFVNARAISSTPPCPRRCRARRCRSGRRSRVRRCRGGPSAPCRRRTRLSARGSLPSSFATTFCDSILRSVFVIAIDAVTPSGTGLKSRVERLLLQRVEVLPGHREERLRRVERDPALDRRRGPCSCPASRDRTSRPRLPCTTANG